MHAAIFALPAALGVAAGLRWWLVGAVLAVHAPISEFVQYHWLPGRNGDPWDVVADVGGVALGLAIGCLLPTPGRGRGLLKGPEDGQQGHE